MARRRISELSKEELACEMELLREETEALDQATGMFLLLVEIEWNLIESGDINPELGETLLGLAAEDDGSLVAIIGRM